MRKIFRLADTTLFFSAEKKMNDHRLPENGLKAGKQIAENTVFSLFGKKRHARMRCPFAKGMHSRTYSSFANQRRMHLSGRPLESKIPFPLTFRFLPTARDSRICNDGSVKARIREPCRTGINILTVCTLNFTQCSLPKVFFPYRWSSATFPYNGTWTRKNKSGKTMSFMIFFITLTAEEV